MDSKIIVNPTFTILDWEKAESILNKCTEGTKKHEGCLYYEVIVNNEEGKMTAECREAWACANSLKEHIYGSEGIGGIMGALVEPGVATLDQIYLTGPPQNSQRPRRSLRPLERLDSKVCQVPTTRSRKFREANSRQTITSRFIRHLVFRIGTRPTYPQ